MWFGFPRSSSSQNLFSWNMLMSELCRYLRTVFYLLYFLTYNQRFLSDPVNSDILIFPWRTLALYCDLRQFFLGFSQLRSTFLNLLVWLQSSFWYSTFEGCFESEDLLTAQSSECTSSILNNAHAGGTTFPPFWREFPHHLMRYPRHGALFLTWFPQEA